MKSVRKVGKLPRLALGTALSAGGLSAFVACASLSDTSPIPSADASDLDGGFVPSLEDSGGGSSSAVDSGPPPASGRIRLANLLQNAGPVDFCAKGDFPGAAWEGQKVLAPLDFGQVSAHTFVSVPTSAGSRYQFRIIPAGTACDGDAGVPPYVSIASGTNTNIRQGGGLTVAVVGVAGADAGTESAPKGVIVADNLSPPPAFALIRIIHGVADLAAFDMLVNGDPIVSGVKYGSGIGYDYQSTTGFAQLAGGIPEGATITLKSGTTARNFKVPARVRRGVADTIFAGGRVNGSPPLTVSLCADRSPSQGETLSTCSNLQAEN